MPMQIRKTYREVNPDLLYHELIDLARKQGATVGETKIETYSLPTDSSSFITRATLSLKLTDESGNAAKECCQVNIVGSAKSETKLMIDVDDKVFPQEKVAALQSDLDFIFGSNEVKPNQPLSST